MNVKEFENERWSRDDQKIFFRHKAAFDLVDDGSRVLDLGCGDGLMLSLLEKKSVTGRGIDLSEKGIEKAKNKGLDVSVFDFGSGERLPFDDESFDGVVILDVLEHLYDPLTVLKEAVRVSKNFLIIGVPNFSSLPARIQTLFGKVPENNHPNKGHVYWFNYRVLENIVNNAGLRLETIRVNGWMGNTPIVGVITNLLVKIFPSVFALSFVVKVCKK